VENFQTGYLLNMKLAVLPLELTFPGGSIYCFELIYVLMTTTTVTGNGGRILLVLINCKPIVMLHGVNDYRTDIIMQFSFL
jgi:hypothetical protein